MVITTGAPRCYWCDPDRMMKEAIKDPKAFPNVRKQFLKLTPTGRALLAANAAQHSTRLATVSLDGERFHAKAM